MAIYICLIWIGIRLQAPYWYYICPSIGLAVQMVQLIEHFGTLKEMLKKKRSEHHDI